MKQLFYIVFISLLLFCGCDKECPSCQEEPYWPQLGVTEDITQLIQPQTSSVSFPFSVHDTLGIIDVELYSSNGSGNMTLRSSIYPFYAFEGSGSSGDYYIFRGEVSVENENMYKGNVNHLHPNSQGWESTTYICGYYMSELRVKYFLKDTSGSVVGEFPVGHSPTPLTTVGSTTYTSGFDWNIGVKIKLGYEDTSFFFKLNPIVWGIKFNNTKKRDIPDMEVFNTSSINEPQYSFVLHKLPMSTESYFFPNTPPLLATTTATYNQDFIWRVPTTKDYQGSDVKFTIAQIVEIDYGICSSVLSPVGKGPSVYLNEILKTIVDTSYIDLIPPSRIPTGKLKLTNTSSKKFISDISIAKKGEAFKSVTGSSIQEKNSLELFLDVGEYDIEFKMGTSRESAKTYKLALGSTQIAQDEVTELSSSYHFVEKK